MLETQLHFCYPEQALPKTCLQHHSAALGSAVLGTETFGVCRCWQKQWESHRLGSKNLKALFYSGYSDLTWVRERRFEPLHNIHSNCSFPKSKIFPGRLPQGEILSLQLRAEVVFKQEGEEQAHSAIPHAWKAASDLLARFFSSSRGHGVSGCVFVTPSPRGDEHEDTEPSAHLAERASDQVIWWILRVSFESKALGHIHKHKSGACQQKPWIFLVWEDASQDCHIPTTSAQTQHTPEQHRGLLWKEWALHFWHLSKLM